MNHEVRFGLQCLGLSGAAVLLGYFPTVWLAGQPSILSLIAGVSVSLTASLAGAVPVALVRNGAAKMSTANAVLAGMLIRFVVVLALALSVALSGMVNRSVFLVWVGISYMALLAADTRYALRGSAVSSGKERN